VTHLDALPTNLPGRTE